MDGIDPETLLEWLQTGIGDERDLQLMALEQLCMLLLMADNIDRCFESCPPRTFIPALCKIFIDETAPDNVLEVTARAITYYLDVSNECTRRITQVDGAVKAICARLAAAEMSDRSSKDLAEQCVKLLEHVCQRETMAVYDAGGINAMLNLVRVHGAQVHKDTMYSAMSVVTRLCGKMEPTDTELGKCAESLGALLEHEDPKVSESALRCFAALTDRFVRKMMDPAELAMHSNLIEHLISIMLSSNDENAPASANILSIVLSLIGNLCRGSSVITEKVLTSPNMIKGLKATLTNKEERVVTDGLRLCDLLLVLLCEGRSALPLTCVVSGDYAAGSGAERVHRQLIDAIRQKDLTALVDAIESGQVDVNFADDVGQSLTNWASAFGSIEMVHYLCEKGADVNKGHKSSSLHYAACFGRPDVVKLLLQRGANPDLRDEDGKTALDKARERADDDHNQVANILESPSAFMRNKEEQKTKASTSQQPGTSAKPELPNPVLVCKVLHQLLPIFCEIFQKSLNAVVRRTSLSLMRKIVENIGDLRQKVASMEASEDPEAIRKMSTDVSAGAESLVGVVVSVLDQEDDHEGHEQVLLILESLLDKDAELWVNELVRLGVFERVEALAKEPPRGLEEVLSALHLEGRSRATPMEIDFEHASSSSSSAAPVATAPAPAAASSSSASSSTAPIAQDIMMDTSVPPPFILKPGSAEGDATSSSQQNSEQMEEGSDLAPAPRSSSRPLPTPLPKQRPSASTASSAINQIVSKISSVVDKTSSSASAAAAAAASAAAAAADKKPQKLILNQGTPYRWKEWRIVRGPTALFVWSDVLLIELPFQSNGWFRYLADNDSHVQFVSGTANVDQQMTDDEKTNFQRTERREMVSRWNAVKGVFDDDWATVPVSVLGIPSSAKKLEVPAWELWSSKSSELQIKSTSSSQPSGQMNIMTTTIKDDSGGFIFESGSGRKQTVMPETALPLQFHTGWSTHGVSTRKMKFRQDIQRRKVQELAWKLWNDHLKEAQAKPREALQELEHAAEIIESVVKMIKSEHQYKHRVVKQGRIDRVHQFTSAMKTVYASVVDDRRISTFEFSVSKIVPALFNFLSIVDKFPENFATKIFKETFVTGDSLSMLAMKIVAVLEAAEKFPQYLYDTPGGSSFGLQLLSRRVRTKLEMIPRADGKENDENVVNKTGKIIKCEPLATVGTIRSYLMKLVARQWHDRDRLSWRYVKEIQEVKERGEAVELRYASDFDSNGIIYWIGTNAHHAPAWSNPALVKAVKVTCSDARQPFGKPEDVLSRDTNPINCHTSDDKNAHFTIDLGVFVVPTSYTLRHSRGYGRSALRNWNFQGSLDAIQWDTIIAHTDDKSLGEPGSTATWHVAEKGAIAYRYFRLAQNGKNSSGQTHYLSCSGFEIYGDIIDVVLDAIVEESPKREKPEKDVAGPSSSSSGAGPSSYAPLTKEQVIEMLPAGEQNNRMKSGLSIETVTAMMQRARHRSRLGYKISDSKSRVVRGKDWRWEDQDGGEGKFGRITSPPEAGWVDVTWENGYSNSYRFGANGHFDIERVTSSGLRMPSTPAHITHSVVDVVRRSRGLYSPKPSAGGPSSSVFSGSSSSAGPSSSSNRPGPSSTLSRFASVKNPPPSGSGAQGSSSSSSSGAAIGKKSMSTTNLVDERQKASGPSVASTGQAASAESLQHQTPSLENLLARAMPQQFGRIAENQEQEDEPMGGEESDSAASMRSAASSSNSQLSMGSQPATDPSDTPRDSAATPSADKNNTLSVSAPDLAAARQRAASAEAEGDAEDDAEDAEDKTVGDAMEEDDEEEETMEDEEEDDDDEEDGEESSNEKFAEMLSGERGLFDKLKEVITREAISDGPSTSAALKADHTNEAQKKGGAAAKKPKKWFKKMSSYTDVLKGLMANRYSASLLDPTASGIEMDELMDEDDYYDFSEDGRDDERDSMEEEVAAHLGMPVDSFASMVAARRERAAMARAVASSRGSPWEDETVIKCTFEALIPAFDPRPGRANVNQTLEVELPGNVNDSTFYYANGLAAAPTGGAQRAPKRNCDGQLRFFLRGPNMSGVDNVTVEMTDDSSSLFRYMQLINNHVNWATKNDRARRIWEPTYSICYCSAEHEPNVEPTQIPDEEASTPPLVNLCLELIGLLSRIQELVPLAEISPTVFISDKLTMKVTQVLSDALVVSAGALPKWCSRLIFNFPWIFSVDTRNMYLQATAFGVSRTIVWLQNRRDAAVERARGSAQAGNSNAVRHHDRYHEYRVGRLRHERVRIKREEETLLEQAVRLMKFHADRKSVLEIEYTNEEGTGLGPTLEFYALVAAELQRKALALWVCDDDDTHASKNPEEREIDLGEGKKPVGYYVRRMAGLFPAPLPPGSNEAKKASDMFRVLGIFLAKVLLDGRLVDLPLSRPFLKLLVNPQFSDDPDGPILHEALTLDDFEEVNQVKGSFLKELRELVKKRTEVEKDTQLDKVQKRQKIDELRLHIKGSTCRLEDLALTFTVNPPSKVFHYQEMELVEGGAEIDVTMDNVDLYVEKCQEFYLNTGIAMQMRSFREGFERVFPIRNLLSYSPEEVQRLLSGEQCPEWTRDDILNYTEPKLGYTRESPGFLRFVDVMESLTPQERKNFLQFATGCSSLPPGGLANLHPRLTIVRKVESGDGSYPSVNTCVHYLKLPEYSSAEILRERLLTAINEKGFHLN